MQRPIEFRIWCLQKNKFYHSKDEIAMYLNGDVGSVCTADGQLATFDNQSLYVRQQFTGLLDKNGKKIFEGDIVKVTWTKESGMYYANDAEDIDYLGAIEWTAKFAEFQIVGKEHRHGFGNDDIIVKIIGNIFEHPQLLK